MKADLFVAEDYLGTLDVMGKCTFVHDEVWRSVYRTLPSAKIKRDTGKRYLGCIAICLRILCQ
jgi:hypothetical protein